MVVLSVIDIVLLIAGLAFYLFVVGTPAHPDRDQPRGVRRPRPDHRRPTPSRSCPGVEHINRTGGVVAGALPLLYGMAEGIVAGVTPRPTNPAERPAARPAIGPPPVAAARRCRLRAAEPRTPV